MAHVEIERKISFFSFGFARVTEVRHIYLVNNKHSLFFNVDGNFSFCIKRNAGE